MSSISEMGPAFKSDVLRLLRSHPGKAESLQECLKMGAGVLDGLNQILVGRDQEGKTP